jgi:hypothetical protein
VEFPPCPAACRQIDRSLLSWKAAHTEPHLSSTLEQAFKELKGDLSIRPIYHQLETRVEAHIFIAFLAYCLLVTSVIER